MRFYKYFQLRMPDRKRINLTTYALGLPASLLNKNWENGSAFFRG